MSAMMEKLETNLKIPIVFDNDCISSFSWIHKLDLIKKAFKNPIIIPEPVYSELSMMKRSRFSYVFTDIKKEIENDKFIYKEIKITDIFFKEYLELISVEKDDWIGKGEASAIVIARHLNGVLASNNLSDVLPHIKGGQPPLICTENILVYCYEKKLISEDVGESMWQQMKDKKRKLPNCSFHSIIQKYIHK